MAAIFHMLKMELERAVAVILLKAGVVVRGGVEGVRQKLQIGLAACKIMSMCSKQKRIDRYAVLTWAEPETCE